MPDTRASARPRNATFTKVHGLVKTLAVAVGFLGSWMSLMACVGAVTSNGYARVIIALVVAVAVPLILADRLLPDDPLKAPGLASDVLSVTWLAFVLVFTIVVNKATKPLLVREGDRLVAEGWVNLGRTVYFLAGVNASIPPPVVVPEAPPPAPEDAGVDAGGVEDAAVEAAPAGEGASAPAQQPADAGAGNDGGDGGDAGAAVPMKGDKSPAELFKELAPSVVTIFVKGEQGEGGGTGFLLDKEGSIVTNHHVIAGMAKLRIKFYDGAAFEEVELLADDSANDLALLRIDLKSPRDGGAPVDVEPVVLGDSDVVVVGERAISIGNPLGLEHTLTDGLVSSRRMYEGRPWIQISVPVSPGNSGGPLFNMRGEVIGITTAQIGAGFGRAQNLNLAVPVNDLKKLLRSEYPHRRKFGESAGSQW